MYHRPFSYGHYRRGMLLSYVIPVNTDIGMIKHDFRVFIISLKE